MQYEDYNDYELMYLASENEELAYEVIYQKYQPIVHKYATKYFFCAINKGLDYQDLVQEGCIGLCRAIERFDKERSMFYTFAILCIEKQIQKILNKANSKKNNILNNAIVPDDFKEEILYSATDSYKISNNSMDDTFFENKIIDFKHSLDLTKSYIFELRYNYFSYKEISVILDISEKQVDNSLLSIRKSLKKYLKEEKTML